MGLVRRLVPVLALVAAPLVLATPAGAAGTVLTVTPNTNLTAGQVVDVFGSGFTPGATVGWCQGVQDATPAQDDCGGTSLGLAFADGAGNITVKQQLARFLNVPSVGATIDCANPTTPCVELAAEANDIAGTVAYAQLHFAAPVVIPGSATVAEANSGAHNVAVPVHLSEPSSQIVTVEWSTIDVPGAPDFQADPATDYTPASGTVTFLQGETSKTVPIAVNGDTLFEPDEYIVVSFNHPTNATMGGFWGLGFGVIADDDHPTVVPGAASVVEGNTGTTTDQVPVTLTKPSTQTITVQWTTLFVPGAPAGQADPASDYTPVSGTVTFAPGETAKSVPIAVNGDTLVEPDEYIVVSFNHPTNATMGGFWGLGFGGITNDD